MNEPEKKNWWGRNWKWFVPIGCFGLVALFMCFFAAIFFFVFSMMKSSDAYKQGFSTAINNEEVQLALGTPIEAGMFVAGNINVSGASGQANLSIPISGPLGDATIYLEATKSGGRWSFHNLEVEITGSGQSINLLEEEEYDNDD
ncbi:MAG: hypothetical protein COA79_02100 [Planctomycetota bacterium]|nr:MAG: hypothetical protein COA79_02100 [Planctomycetota bacterium]